MESTDYISDDELLVANDDFICELCSLEFPNSSERTEHILQHFKQSVCSGCGETLICIGDIWYGPHTDSNCFTAKTDYIRSEVPASDEEDIPGFIEVKQEEIVDIDDENEVLSDFNEEEMKVYYRDSDLYAKNELDQNETDETEQDENETRSSMDEQQANEEQEIERHNESSNVSDEAESTVERQDVKYKVTLVHHNSKCIGYKAEPCRASEDSIEDFDQKIDKETIGGEEISTGLTREQLSKRTCPICGKVIVNKQNLICHMNIHSGKKPFRCDVCTRSFAHIRNLIRHKEQQGHGEFLFKCTERGCRERFISSNKLNRHIKLDHHRKNPQQCPYSCSHCRRSFSSLGNLKMHMREGHKTVQ